MKTFTSFLITGILVCFFCSVSAQTQKTRFTLLSHAEIKTGTDHIEEIFVDTVYQKYILWFNAITPGQNEPNSNYPEQISESGIYDMNGTRYLMHPWEKPFTYFHDTLYGKVSPHFGKSDFYLYILNASGLTEKLSRLQLETREVYPIQNGRFLSWNEGEFPATRIDMLNRDFTLVQHLTTGFSSFIIGYCDEYDGKLLVTMMDASNQDADSLISRFLILNAANGQVLHQFDRKYPRNQSSWAFMDKSSVYVNTFDFATGTPVLSAFTFTGQALWTNSTNVDPTNHAFLRNRKIAVLPGNAGLKTLSLNNGQTVWNIDIPAFRSAIMTKFPNVKAPENLLCLKTVSLDTDDKNPCIIARVCDYKNGPNGEKNIVANYICLIKSDGSIADILNYGSTPEILEVFNVRGELWLLDEKNLNRYEIIKN